LYTNTSNRFYGVSDGVSVVYLDTPQLQYLALIGLRSEKMLICII
jgi:hypothetical protein